MPTEIVIAKYDPDWPRQFEAIKLRVAQAMGMLAVAIEHVGSTSVPDLGAKPIIDLAIAVPGSGDIPDGIRRLASIGYIHEGDLGIEGREAFSTPPDSFSHHPYLMAVDSREYRRQIAFRDRLRADAAARQEYEDLKRKLAVQFRLKRDDYSKNKTEFVERILREELGSH